MSVNAPFKNFFGKLSEEPMEEKKEAVLEGKIIKVSDKGWGFIICKDIPFTRIFFHWTALTQDTRKFPELKRGMDVTFVAVDKGTRGTHAIKVRIVEPKPEATPSNDTPAAPTTT